ncbi:hypothetical protein WA538_002216, partial [Blastocystis sp. DL]
MRRKSKEGLGTDWRLSIQTIHAMVFLVGDSTNEDSAIKTFTKPLIYKDMLLSAVFPETSEGSSNANLPPWLSGCLSDGLFDCFYKCTLSIQLSEENEESLSLADDVQSQSRYFLQAVIKPCPNHLSSYQVRSQQQNLPSFPSQCYTSLPLMRQLVSYSLLPDNSTCNTHISLSLPVLLQNSLVLRPRGNNGECSLFLENRGSAPIIIDSFVLFIADVVFAPTVIGPDFAIVHSYELPRGNPTILSDIRLTAESPSGITLPAGTSREFHLQVNYMRNHAAASSTFPRDETSACDVFLRARLQWRQGTAGGAFHREVDLRARLHPKPQMEIRLESEGEMKLLQTKKLRVEVTNLSLHTYRGVAVRFENGGDFALSVIEQTVEESLPHAVNAFFVAATPLLPGVRKLPTAVCFDEEGKELPSQCVATQVTV